MSKGNRRQNPQLYCMKLFMALTNYLKALAISLYFKYFAILNRKV